MTQDVMDITRQEPQFRSLDVGEPMQALSAFSEELILASATTNIGDNSTTQSLQILGAEVEGQDAVFTKGALNLLSVLCDNFASEIPELLEQREIKKAKIGAGQLPDFLSETASIRKSNWQIRGIPDDLTDRRVEVVASVERKMVINALNANAKVYIADFENSVAPSWSKVIEGQINLSDAIRGDIEYTDQQTGKQYQLNDDAAVLICGVRGLDMLEKNVEFNGVSIPAALFDFALYFHNNYLQLLNKGSAPYFYIPKLESHFEARWWAQVFTFVEERFCLQPGTIKCTCLIETLPAVFEMEEILFELRSNIVALNCGRWDSIFSGIKTLSNDDAVLSRRKAVTMDKTFLSAYSRLLVKVCHKRGALAIGGTTALIPVKDDIINEDVLEQISRNKQIEARNGHDGTWVNHPDFSDTAMAIFNQFLGEGQKNQLHITRDVDGPIRAQELLITGLILTA
ncbi:malate synthase [Shewanella eurypsychrophilus]|uniref:malate synthase n=1 Tax=Shewanella eurypsychrophilus TaxID=2593656 RepID=A0ABX6V870_9GAMM|nr:malate synthase A [Shewanella sp. YLB-09]QPG58798.1 malate synthase [Shewanella eurypsychrophilus]